MKKIILFDLYDTIVQDISFHFMDGIKYLYDTFFSKACSWQEMTAYSATFLSFYEERKIKYNEICLIKDEIPLFFKKFGVAAPDSFAELDYVVMNQMQKVNLAEDVADTLNTLFEKGIGMYILSNSIFTGESAKKMLNGFGILQYFKKIYSSADYGIRKPCSKFYQTALDEIFSDNPKLRRTDLLYVGNDYETDVMGATSMGLSTVWYNVKHLPNTNHIFIDDIDQFKNILEIIQR